MRIDNIKEKIGYLKLWLGILLVTNVSLFSWLIQQFDSAKIQIIFGCMFCIIFITIILFKINKKIINNITYLEEL